MKNLKSLFIALVTSSANTSNTLADIKAQKPWTKPATVKNEIDGAMVRSLASHYGFSYGAYDSEKAVYSRLAIKSPGKDAVEETKRRYGAARKALAMARKLFDKPVEHAAANLTDRKHAEAKRLAKFTAEQVKAIVALAAKYREQ